MSNYVSVGLWISWSYGKFSSAFCHCFELVDIPNKPIEQIYNSMESEVHILTDQLEEPLWVLLNLVIKFWDWWYFSFIISDPCGQTLTTTPFKSGYIFWAIHALSELAGLAAGGSVYLRRDAGNWVCSLNSKFWHSILKFTCFKYGMTLGKDLAAMMLRHRDPQKVFNTHYSWSTENIPLMKLQVGEIGGDGIIDVSIFVVNNAVHYWCKYWATPNMHNLFHTAVTVLIHKQSESADEPVFNYSR